MTRWKGPGSRGVWVDEAGRRHVLQDTDEPMASADGTTVLVRVVYPPSMVRGGHWEHQRDVWVARLEGGAYAYRGRIDLVDDEWAAHGLTEDASLAPVGSFVEREDAIRRLAFGERG